VLPDGIFSNQKSQFGSILDGLLMEDVGIFMAIYFSAKWCILHLAILYISWSFCTFFPFWYVVLRNIWQPCPKALHDV
jgi:hypothetical protein